MQLGDDRLTVFLAEKTVGSALVVNVGEVEPAACLVMRVSKVPRAACSLWCSPFLKSLKVIEDIWQNEIEQGPKLLEIVVKGRSGEDEALSTAELLQLLN